MRELTSRTQTLLKLLDGGDAAVHLLEIAKSEEPAAIPVLALYLEADHVQTRLAAEAALEQLFHECPAHELV